MAARATGSNGAARLMLEKGFGHLRSSAVAGAEEEHTWSPPRRVRIEVARIDDVHAQPRLESGPDLTKQIGAAPHVHAVVSIAPVRGAAAGGDDARVAQSGEVVR